MKKEDHQTQMAREKAFDPGWLVLRNYDRTDLITARRQLQSLFCSTKPSRDLPLAEGEAKKAKVFAYDGGGALVFVKRK